MKATKLFKKRGAEAAFIDNCLENSFRGSIPAEPG